MGLFV